MASNNPNMNSMFYDPSSEELPFYEHLFQTADVSKTGQINGRDAVTFLAKSKLPLDLLKNIWNIADQNPKTNTLDKRKFFIALRLIQLAQNGVPLFDGGNSVIGGDLALVGGGSNNSGMMRAPFFEGVTNTNTNAPQRQQQQQQQPPSTMTTPARPTSAVLDTPQPTPRRPEFKPTPSQRSLAPVAPTTTQLTHDPFAMTPSEKSRYETLFPQYAKDDGFVYGKEAVELFTKSGLDKGLLRNIWNMVDHPVDNRLSQLEFAIAMHLIVCVSKKNLPMPTLIPPSLKRLKDMEGNVNANASTGSGASAGGIPSPVPQSPSRKNEMSAKISSPPHHRQVHQQAPPQQLSGAGTTFGGMSISDAFENMATNNDRSSTTGSDVTPTTAHNTPKQQSLEPPLQQVRQMMPTSSVAAPIPSTFPDAMPPSITSTASVGETSVVSTDELKNLQAVLQKMQAENISLRAQLGQCSQEELSVRKEISQTVAEISSLSMELTSLRARVADAKSSLIEATSELKAQIEKRDILKSLLEDAAATQKAIELGALKIKELEEVAREAKKKNSPRKKGEDSKSPDPPTPYDQGFFSYDQADSGRMNDMLKSHNSIDMPTTSPAPNYNPYLGNQATHAQSTGPPQQMPPMPPNDPPASPRIHSHPSQQQGTSLPDPPVEDFQKLEELKLKADQVARNADEAADEAHALAVQYEDLRAQAERAEILFNEKKPRKKGLFGGKREAKKEAEQARQMSQMKTNEAQHAHLAMKNAEDKAKKLKKEAQSLRKKSEDFELELTKRVSEQEEAQRVTEMQRMQSNTTSVSITSDLSYSNSYAPPMGFGRFTAAPSPVHPSQMNDAEVMGGSIGYGDGVMGGYASSVGFTDNSVYSMSNSVTGSINYGNGHYGNNALSTGYTSDAASYVTSEPLLYPPLETPTNAGDSVAGMLSVTGSIGQPGSVTNVPTGYMSDAPSRSVSSEMFFHQSTNNDDNSLSHRESNTKPPFPPTSEMSFKLELETSNINAHSEIKKSATGASNDTETINNTTSSIQNNGITSEGGLNFNANQCETLPNSASYDSSIGQMNSNDFSSYQGPDFSGIPSPEKEKEIIPTANPAYVHGNDDQSTKVEVQYQQENAPVNPEPSTVSQLNVTIPKETSSNIDSTDFNLIPSPEEAVGEVFQDEVFQNQLNHDAINGIATPVVANDPETVYSAEDNSGSNSAIEAYHESSNDTIENIDNVATSDAKTQTNPNHGLIPLQDGDAKDGLIPSPRITSVGLMVPSPEKDVNEITTYLGAAMSLSVDSEFPDSNVNNNDHGMNQTISLSNETTAPYSTIISTAPPALTPALSMSQSADSVNLHTIMSLSTDGGIPTPTQSRDEYDKAFFQLKLE